jgi:hypothetical protein
MKHVTNLCSPFSAALLCFAMLSGLSMWAEKPSTGVVEALERKYVVTQTTSDFAQITKDGTTMSMKCPGVYSIPSNLMMKPDNKVVDGKVQAPGTLAKYTLVKMGAHVLQTGEKVYITKIESKSEMTGDSLKFTLLTVDELDVSGSDAKKKYDAYVSFKFKKGYLDETPPEQVEQTIESVLAPEEAAAPEPQQQAAVPARPAAPATPPAPVVPATPAGPPPTITMGESSSEVLQAMGMPLQMIDLGKKKTYVYKNMKIVFLNDKVSDVQ